MRDPLDPELERSPTKARSLRRIFISLLAIYLLLSGFALLGVDALIFPAPPSSYQDGPEIIKLTTENGRKISAVYCPVPGAEFTLLFSHGNGEDLGDNRPFFRALNDLGFSVFAYDYQGYGTSEGSPSESNTYHDINAAYSYMTQDLGISPQQIILHGRSVGTGPTVDLATRAPCAAVILEAPFVSIFRVVLPWPLLPFDRFNNLKKISGVNVPLLVIHGRRDGVIAFRHGERIFAAANEPKRNFWVDGAGHNDVQMIAGEAYEETLREFAALVREPREKLDR